MNTDYYQFGSMFYNGPDRWFYGHFTGSGMPMRFADEDGRILNIYQQVTQFGDEGFLEVQVDGKPASFTPWKVGGVSYGLVTLETSSHHLQARYSQ
jgi:hypothetical protein